MDIVRESIILLSGKLQVFHWESISSLYAQRYAATKYFISGKLGYNQKIMQQQHVRQQVQ